MSKGINLILLILVFTSCVVTSKTKSGFWAEVDSESTYLFLSMDTTSTIDTEIQKGSVLYFTNKKENEFHEVYLRNPKGVEKEFLINFRRYVYKPQITILNYKYQSRYSKIYELPFDESTSYIRGERGGCYYINKNGNRSYVNRDYCGVQYKTYTPSKITKQRSTNTKCNTVQCSGRTQKGIRCKNRTSNCSGRCHQH